MTITACILLLILLQLKHWFVDFVIQLEPAAPHKFMLLDVGAIVHSFQQGIGTALAMILVFPNHPLISAILGLTDFVVHHIIDFGKTKIDEVRPWSLRGRFFIIGVDQLMHQFTYLGFVVLLLWQM